MKRIKVIMGMPITIEILDKKAKPYFGKIFSYFRTVDARYSTYKSGSEISKINRGLPKDKWSKEMKLVMALCEKTKNQTGGYFNIENGGKLDPSGLVKGWAINNAANQLIKDGVQDFYIEAGGDIQTHGSEVNGVGWSVGIRNPFNLDEIIKTIQLSGKGVATSGSYIRGQHIYDPHKPAKTIDQVSSMTVIGPNIYEADRFATAAYAMGGRGIDFIESMPGFEGYMVTKDELATLTSGFDRYVTA